MSRRYKMLFATILASDQTFRIPATEGAAGSVRRDWSNPKTGASGSKHEYIKETLTGFFRGIKLKEIQTTTGSFSQYNIILQVDEDSDNVFSVSIPKNNQFAAAFLKKIPNIDPSQKISLNPFSFTPKGKEKKITGISMTQGGDKLNDFFYREDRSNPYNVPQADEGTQTKEYWRYFFSKLEAWYYDFYIKEVSAKIEPLSLEGESEETGPSFNQMASATPKSEERSNTASSGSEAASQPAVNQDPSGTVPLENSNETPDDDLPF